MPFTGGSPATRDQIYLDRIATSQDTVVSAALDASSIANSWMTLDLFSAIIATNTTTTGPVLTVKNSSSQTIMVDVTGVLLSGTANATGATGLILSLQGGLSGFGFITLRTTTAGLGIYAWKVAAAGVTSGATADTTGVTRVDNMFLTVTNPASATGGSVNVRARLFSSPDF